MTGCSFRSEWVQQPVHELAGAFLPGVPQHRVGWPRSTTTPPSMKMTLSATARANASSWAITTVVQPSSANPLMTVRTSPTNSESKRRFRHIKKQKLRTHGQCTHNAHTLRLAAGALEGVAVFLVFKPHAGLSFLSASRRHHGSQLGMAYKNGTKASDHYRHWQLARPQKSNRWLQTL